MNHSAITNEDLEMMRNAYLSDDKARVVRNALVKNDIATIARVFEAEVANPNIFTIDLKTMPATNQQATGRCWIFSGMNLLREKIAKKYNIKDFELSQNFIAFYDKIEKANWFIECTLKELDSDLSHADLMFLLHDVVADGGQWNMLQGLIEKYGLCPKSAMPETYQSSHTRTMNKLLNRRLRKFVADSRNLYASGSEAAIASCKKKTMADVYRLVADCFGVPPQEFTFEYYDADGNAHAEYHVTPLDFYKNYLDVDVNDYINCINSPTTDKPYNKLFTVKYLGNVVDGHPIELLNISMEDFKAAALAQLKAGEPVWFGCDAGADGDRDKGLWDDKAFDYETTFDIDFSMTKSDMLDYWESAMNHAMLLTGVNLDENGKPNRWKIENSWGDKPANKGYYIASDTWFEKYMYVIAVRKEYLPAKAVAALNETPVELAPWDPFGTLAD